MIAYCGLNCSECECFSATQNDDDKKREEVAAKWSAQYHTEIKAEQINCDGCKSDGVLFFFCEGMCEIRKCNIERNSSNCTECEDYKCGKLEKFIEMAPPVGDALKALRQQ